MPGKPKQNESAKHHLAPTIRGAFLRGLKLHEANTGLTFSEIMAEQMQEHGVLYVMERVSKFTERTTEAKIEHSGEVNLVNVLSNLASREHDTAVESEPGTVRH